jgi:1-phosphofructokinase
MIYTITFNPALDYVLKLDSFEPGCVNRTVSEHMLCGGKGINVSHVLKNLGVESVALGFIAGFTGDELKRGLDQMGVKSDFVKLSEGFSRINIKIKTKTETEINCQGPNISEKAINMLFEKLDHLKSGDILVLAGSIPQSLPGDIYEKILHRLDGRGVYAVVDATGKLLLNVLKYRPFLIKPNHIELGEVCSKDLKGAELDTIAGCARQLIDKGAQNVLVSMAGDGALFVPKTGDVIYQPAAKGKVKNSVGAGDSMVAGFIAEYFRSKDPVLAIKYATAAGGASAFSEDFATCDAVEKLLRTL